MIAIWKRVRRCGQVRQRDFPHADQNESDFSLGPEIQNAQCGEMENHAMAKKEKY